MAWNGTGTEIVSADVLERDTEVKPYLRIDTANTTENDVLDGLIAAARQHGEEYLGRALLTQTRTMTLDGFPVPTDRNKWAEIVVPFPPLRSVTSIQYVDTNGNTQTLAATYYTVHVGSGDSRSKGRIARAYNATWPTVRYQKNAVTITYSCGYGVGADVPRAIRQGLLWLVGHMYENREAVAEKPGDVLPMAVDRIWAPYRIMEAL